MGTRLVVAMERCLDGVDSASAKGSSIKEEVVVALLVVLSVAARLILEACCAGAAFSSKLR